MAGEPDRHTHPEHAGASLRFDLQQGFPAVTTKKLAFKSAIGELVGFLRATRSAAEFRELGCKVWDQNANENAQWLANPYREGLDDLGPVYGVQWRQWPAYKVLDAGRRRRSPTPWRAAMPRSRTWTKAALPRCCSTRPSTSCASAWTRSMSAPATAASCSTAGTGPRSRNGAAACHLLYQFLPNASTREISLCLYIRSNDVGLGTPFNLTEGAALLHLVGRLTGYTPRWFTYFIGDAHIYENHLPMLREQLSRTPFEAPPGAVGPHPRLRGHWPLRAGMAGAGRAGRFHAGRLYAPRAAHGADGGGGPERYALPQSAAADRKDGTHPERCALPSGAPPRTGKAGSARPRSCEALPN